MELSPFIRGASQSVQRALCATFVGCLRLISLMEHELMSSDKASLFEYHELCQMSHANLFKNAGHKGLRDWRPDHPGHPVQIFKQGELQRWAAMIPDSVVAG